MELWRNGHHCVQQQYERCYVKQEVCTHGPKSSRRRMAVMPSYILFNWAPLLITRTSLATKMHGWNQDLNRGEK